MILAIYLFGLITSVVAWMTYLDRGQAAAKDSEWEKCGICFCASFCWPIVVAWILGEHIGLWMIEHDKRRVTFNNATPTSTEDKHD